MSSSDSVLDSIGDEGGPPSTPPFLPTLTNDEAVTVVESDIPARLDNIPFSLWHLFIVIALGITWVLDGLEVTITSVVGSLLEDTLHLTKFEVGVGGSAYLLGAVVGSLVFGFLCDRYGRKRLYVLTPLIYLSATFGTAFVWEVVGFVVLRFCTGLGLGGEYSAMNSAIDELLPASVRGMVDIAVNGSYWVGAGLAAIGSLAVLNSGVLPDRFSWRALYLIGALLGGCIIVLRLFLPESPRWLLIHGRVAEAEAVVQRMEEKAMRYPLRFAGTCIDSRQGSACATEDTPAGQLPKLVFQPRTHTPLSEVLSCMLMRYPRRTVLGLGLMAAQAFFYNAVFFSYALILSEYYDVPAQRVGVYLLPFAAGNFLGAILLGWLFDIVGRKAMICLTYAASGLLLLVTGLLFWQNLLTAVSQTMLWSGVFFVASPAAASAYLTVSELFPLEVRGVAISIFYSTGTLLGGFLAPMLFGGLMDVGGRRGLFFGYVFGGSLMYITANVVFCKLVAAAMEMWLGVNAERKSLEAIAAPLSTASDAES